ncbi:CapA family protein [Nostoc sp. CENA67]|uniref:CapA family protein n=1 Tax=Amazonocrinis nigriterrae CENA67 TaxID=2794033 RepID=A0A8J7L8E0_9NOST|nr:CapA family protein [Amazonocrinis nigriterrae]MBH8561931.1 CapA family protein [Amazonocrinis nigriterrae CENA67]
MTKFVTLAFIGDVMLGRGVNEQMKRKSPESLWGDVLPILRGADAVIANLECAITQQTQEWSRTPKMFYFRADPTAVEVLRTANIQCVSLANNHILDFNDQGLLDTLKYLNAAGIHHVGAGRDISEATTPMIMDIAGLRVGMIALTDNEPDFAATKDSPGINYLEIIPNPLTLSLIESAVVQLRQAGAKLVVLSAHWGPNMVISPPLHFRQFAHAVVDSGVDIFHGHSAHIFQGVENYKQGLILYDTGDFLDDYAVDPVLRNDWSFVFLVEVSDRGLYKLRLIPVVLQYAQVDLAKGEEFTAICHRMQALCAAFNTDIFKTAEGLEVKLRNEKRLIRVL